MTIFPEKCSDKLKITIFASLVYVALVIFTFSPTIEYGTYEWTTSQFLNAVRNFVILGPEALAYKASLMGGSDTSLHSYSNFPIYHMIFSSLLVKYGILENTYASLQLIPILLMLILIVYSSIFVLKRTSLTVAALFCMAIVTNTYLLYSYKDLWWEPYTLFLSIFPLLYMLENPKAGIAPFFLGAIQFIATFDAVIFAFCSYTLIYWFKHKKISNASIFYAIGSVVGVAILLYFRSSASTGNISGNVILENIIKISSADAIRALYYYILMPQTFIVLVFSSITYYFTKDLYFPSIIIISSLLWTLVFPAHGLHHAYHYTKIMLYGLTIYVFISSTLNSKRKYILCASFIAINAIGSVLSDYSIQNEKNSITYQSYSELKNHVEFEEPIITNIPSYQMSYYSDRGFKIYNEKLELDNYKYILIIDDIRQAERGMHIVYSMLSTLTNMIGINTPDKIDNAYNSRVSSLNNKILKINNELSSNNFDKIWHNKKLNATLYTKG